MINLLTNLENRATTHLTHYDFTGYAEFNGKALAIGSDGLYELGGDGYDGVDIDSEIIYPSSDYGTTDQKRTSYLYYTGEAEDNLVASVQFDNADFLAPVTIVKKDIPLQTVPVKLAKGAKGVNIGFKIENTNGCHFAINRLDLLPVILKRPAKR